MRIFSRSAASVVLVSLLAGGAARARSSTQFNPEFFLAYGYTNNLALGGTRGEQTDQFADNFARVDVRLPLIHRWKTGALNVRYAPRILRYQTFGELDRVDHFFDFRFTDKPSRRSVLDMVVDVSASQLQGRSAGGDPADAFLARRTDRQIYRGDIVYRQGFATDWRWSAAASSRLYRYSNIDDEPQPEDSGNRSQVEDRDAWLLGFQIDKDLSRRTFIGGRYERSDFKLEITGEAATHALLFTYERQLDRQSELEFTAGGFTTRGTAVVNCRDFPNDPSCLAGLIQGKASDRSSGFQGDLTYARRFENVKLRLRAEHRPSAGGALLGAIRFTLVQVALSQARGINWRWNVIPRWARRDPLNELGSSRQTVALGGTVTRRIRDGLGVRFRTNYTVQVGDDIDDRNVWSSDIGLIWAPWQSTRMAQR